MLTLILALVAAAADPAPPASGQAPAPKPRKVCHDFPEANSRFMHRVCTVVVDRPAVAAQTPVIAPPPVATTLGVGMAVVDTQGAPVGTITALAAETVTVKTDRYEAQLPRTSLALSDGQALFGLTQAQLNASIEQTQATIAKSALKVGGVVTGTGGASLGTVDAAEGDTVTIRLASGVRISVPRASIAPNAAGGGSIGITAAELEAQVKAANPGH